MYSYNSKDKILDISKYPIKSSVDTDTENYNYKSYNNYLQNDLASDIKEELIGYFKDMMINRGANIGLSAYSLFDVNNIRVEYYSSNYDSTKEPREMYKVLCDFKTGAATYKDVEIFELPYVSEWGDIKFRDKSYGIINTIVRAADITYSSNNKKSTLELVTDVGTTIEISNNTKQPKVTMMKRQVDIFSVISTMVNAYKEMYPNSNVDVDISESINAITNLSIKPYTQDRCNAIFNVYAEKQVQGIMINYRLSLKDAILNHRLFKVANARDSINSTLSLERVAGYTVAKEILLKDGDIIKAGTKIGSRVLEKLYKNQVNTIYIDYNPNTTGWSLNDRFILSGLPKGVVLPKDLIMHVESEFITDDGMTTKDLAVGNGLKNGIIIDKSVIPDINKDVIAILRFNGIREFKAKKGASQVIITTYVEVIGNNTFKGKYLGREYKPDTWYYKLNEDEFVVSGDRLTPHDLLSMYTYAALLKLKIGVNFIAHRDLGLRKRVDNIGDMISKAVRASLVDFTSNVFIPEFKRFKDNRNILENEVNFRNISWYYLTSNIWKHLYKTQKVITELDTVNPVSYYSSTNHINSMFKSAHSISGSARHLSMGHYGRICPFETPSSSKLGVVNVTTIGCKVDNRGYLTTPYYKVVSDGSKYKIDFSKKVYLSVKEEEEFRIVDICSLDFDSDGVIKDNGRVLARVPDKSGIEKMSVSMIPVSKIDYVNALINGSVSVASACMPLAGADDAVRHAYSINMIKQAKNIVDAELAIVTTDMYEDITKFNNVYCIRAQGDGVITESDINFVTIKYDDISIDKDEKLYNINSIRIAYNAVITMNPTYFVRRGANEEIRVKKGDVLAYSNMVSQDGEMAIGVNALVCFVPNGYNYEDGIFASERLSRRTTSYGGKIEKIEFSKDTDLEARIPLGRAKYRNERDEGAIAEVSATIDDKKSKANKRKGTKKRINPTSTTGFIVQANSQLNKYTHKRDTAVIKSVSIDRSVEGDKFANRHGNKGVAPTYKKDSEMLMLANGEFFDLVYNPAGVSSRMVIGQILECNLGLACYVLGIRARVQSYNQANKKEIKYLLHYAHKMANSKGDAKDKIQSEFNLIPREMHEYCYSNIESIRNWANTFDEKGEALVYDPVKESWTTTGATIGVLYTFKLTQEAQGKLAYRGTYLNPLSKVLAKTDGPNKGGKHFGGQRFGNMEIDALTSYGAANLLYELSNPRCDNAVSRNNLSADIVDKSQLKVDRRYGARRSTEMFAQYMRALGVDIDFNNEPSIGLFDKSNIENKCSYSRREFLRGGVMDYDGTDA